MNTRNFSPSRAVRLPLLSLLTVLGLVVSTTVASAQATATATHTQWDIFAATGGGAGATMNVASIYRDAAGAAGPAGSVWVTTQRPETRIGRLDPDTNTYTEWRPLVGRNFSSGAPFGLAVNQSNGDMWVSTMGVPSLLLKVGGTNTFRTFDTLDLAVTPQGLAVAADGSVYAAIPVNNGYGQGRAIIRVPRDIESEIVNATTWRFDQAPLGEPKYIAIDAAGKIWFTDRLTNRLGRLDPAANQSTEWALPAGSSPVGLHFNGTTVCVVSDGVIFETGVVQCLDPATNRVTGFATPSPGLDRPQQIARNSFDEIFVAEWHGNSVVFIGTQAYAATTVTTVVPTVRARPRSTLEFYAETFTVTPTQRTVVPAVTTITGAVVAAGQTRFQLPLASLTYPSAGIGYPQPFGITAAFNDFERGSGTAYIAEYFSGSHGTAAAARISKIEVVAPRLIVTNTSSVSLTATEGSTTPVTQDIAVSEASGLSLNWTAAETEPWLSVSPSSGAAPSTLTITVDPTGLGIGTYTGTVTLDDGPGRADPKAISVSFTVEAPPVLAPSPTLLAFEADYGATSYASTSLTVGNSGGGSLSCAAAATEAWIVATPVGGAGSCTFTVTLSNPPSAAGSYSGSIALTSPGAANSPTSVAVTFLRKNPPASLQVTPASLAFSFTQGTIPAAQSVTITNSGGEVLNWTASASPAWITVPSAGSVLPGQTATVPVSVAYESLPAGSDSGTVTFSSNAAGGPKTVSVTRTVLEPDTTAPIITTPGGLTAEATSGSGATVTFTVTAVDNVSTGLIPSCVPASGTVFIIGTTTVECSVTDGAGNAASASFAVTVSDTTKPVLTVPSTQTAEATGPSGAVVTYTVSATDAVTASLTPSCVPASGSTFGLGSTTVDCSVTDAAGNSATASFTVTVGDSVKPILSLPSVPPVEATSPAGAVVTFSVSANDVVGGALPATCVPASGSTFAVGTTNVNCSAADASGNAATGSFAVTVRDTTAPVLTVPSNITSPNPVSYPAATATDLVDTSVAVVCTPPSGSTFAIGTTTVTCTATDDAGNSASGSFTVTVPDNIAPTLTVPSSVTAVATVSDGVAVTYSVSATDNMPGVQTPICSPASGSVFSVGTTTVSCSVADAAGNQTTRTFPVTVTYTPPPPAVSFTTTPTALYFKTGRLAYCNGIPVGPNWKDQGLVIKNTASTPLNYVAATATGWLRVLPASGTLAAGASATLTVSVDLSHLGRGIYQGAVTVTGNGSLVKTVPVTLEVGNALPTLCPAPPSVSLGTLRTSTTYAPVAIGVVNVGDDPLPSWTVAKTITDGTLAVTPTSGTTNATLFATVKTGKKRGAQSATVTINGSGTIQGVRTIKLTWTVQ